MERFETVNAVKHKSYTPIHRIAALYCTYCHLRKEGRSVLAGLNRHRLQSGSRARHSQGTATATAPALSTCTVRETVQCSIGWTGRDCGEKVIGSVVMTK